MHILLILSYAFSVWMLVDAYQRRAEHYWYLIIFFPFGEWIYFFLVKVHDFRGGLFFSGTDSDCASCRHCAQVDEDGVQCTLNGEPVFRTHVQSGYCTDHERR
jgi:hypothetical protein